MMALIMNAKPTESMDSFWGKMRETVIGLGRDGLLEQQFIPISRQSKR